MKTAYICSPYRGKTEAQTLKNIDYATELGRRAWRAGYLPIVPHVNSQAVFGTFANDHDVVPFDDALMMLCDEVWVCDGPSAGMAHEVGEAKVAGKKIKYLFKE